MSTKNETLPLILSFVITAGIVGGGYWWFTRSSDTPFAGDSNPTQSPSLAPAFAAPTTVPSGTILRLDGATSLAQVNVALKQGFEEKFAGTSVTVQAKGSERGLASLLAGSIDIAAMSRPLTPQEQAQNLVAVPVAEDAIAIIIGVNNPLRTGLSSQQVQQIFTGQLTNWSQVGGQNSEIRVINRPEHSGTHQAFKEMVLQGQSFGKTPNITTLINDETTGLIRQLGDNGIGYATYAQVATQQTAQVLPIDGTTPQSATYPYKRTLFYVYKNPPSEAVKAFLGYSTSEEGKRLAGN
ncbi:phosphate ABC transporter substrate-binding protein [Spirulina subsalsa]|uniref:phosphate ABC transporter substrate-binding protein n=1 Tax=Spirulina subsalsa TaxID=54311 RepID=UPI00030E5684|nr:phosphate ABC transporter substrate-binding protein [Spirulina subsalsa]